MVAPVKSSPDLSVVVTVVGGVPFLRRCLTRLALQAAGRAVEVIVPFDSTSPEIGACRAEFPGVRFVDAGVIATDCKPGTEAAAHEIYDRRTATGLAAAYGEVLALLQDYGAPEPDWCDQLLAAHRLPHGVIGGAVEHEGGGPLNWAVYFQDFGRFQPPLPEGPSPYLTDVNVSYKRAVLDGVRSMWEGRYKEVTVNWALARQGVTLWQRPQVVVRQDRGRLSLRRLVVERYCWGRLFGSIRIRELNTPTRVAYVLLSPAIPLVLLVRMGRKAFAARRQRMAFLRCLPHTAFLTSVWCVGEFVGYLTGREAAA